MKVHVTVELYQGVVNEVHVFRHQISAEQVEQKWREEHFIENEADLQCKEMNGIEFHIFECAVLP